MFDSFSAKLARLLHKQGRTPLLVAADVYRPAAMDQLEKLGQQLELPVFARKGETDVLKIAKGALEFAKANNRNTLIFDTAGRLQIDEPLVQELVRLRELTKPQEILLVLDAATGQEAVNVATHFDQALKITGADRKSTRLNSSHSQISYAVFCLKKKKKTYLSIRRADDDLTSL